MNVRVGLGYDVHPFDPDRPLVLGGVTIEGNRGLAGHSDADAVAHAVADAMLGACALPDLGTMFPADDARHAGASSIALLEKVALAVADRGWWVGNVDVVIAAEMPKLAPHLDAMVANLGTAVEHAAQPMRRRDEPLVSVKPKRGEGLGAIGRGEGIAVWAVALLTRG